MIEVGIVNLLRPDDAYMPVTCVGIIKYQFGASPLFEPMSVYR